MGFVNEYASDEDIEKYELKAVWDKYYARWAGEYFLGNRPEWTIDRDREIYLMVVGRTYGEEVNRVTFLLCWKGHHITAELFPGEQSSKEMSSNPFVKVWELKSINIPDGAPSAKSETLGVLKEALAVYGYWGVRMQVPNTIVRFNF